MVHPALNPTNSLLSPATTEPLSRASMDSFSVSVPQSLSATLSTSRTPQSVTSKDARLRPGFEGIWSSPAVLPGGTPPLARPRTHRIVSAFKFAGVGDHHQSGERSAVPSRGSRPAGLVTFGAAVPRQLSSAGARSLAKVRAWLGGHSWGGLDSHRDNRDWSRRQLSFGRSLSSTTRGRDDEASSASRRPAGPTNETELDIVPSTAPSREPPGGSSDEEGESDALLGSTGAATSVDYPRLFSTLNEATLRHEPGNLTSAILLVAGTTVGAGILAIPAVTQEAGFLASAPVCILCWLYMVTTGLLVAEVNVNTMCELGSGGVSLVSMADRTLGKTGVNLACATYVFIHYALLVAYVARSADIISGAAGVPQWLAAAAFTGALGSLCYFGSQRVLGGVNGALVAAVLASFLGLLALAGGAVDPAALLRADWSAVPPSVPIIALSFVYQNVVPVVASNLEGDLRRVRLAVVFGTAIPLVMFLAWDAIILGSTPAVTAGTLEGAASMASIDPLMRLKQASGLVGPLVDLFSFFAVATSYIGFVLGLADFLADWFKLPTGRGQQPLPYALTLLPPFFLALLNPDIFYKALDYAGTYGVLVLFGIIPGAMAWSERYSSDRVSTPPKAIVPGGKWTLGLVIGGAGAIITSELIRDLVG